MKRSRQRASRSPRYVLKGSPDGRIEEILRYAHARGWVVMTHDSDFGTLAIRRGEPYTGIIYLRPGHIFPSFVLNVLEALDTVSLDMVLPFIVVAERREEIVRVRVRSAAKVTMA